VEVGTKGLWNYFHDHFCTDNASNASTGVAPHRCSCRMAKNEGVENKYKSSNLLYDLWCVAEN